MRKSAVWSGVALSLLLFSAAAAQGRRSADCVAHSTPRDLRQALAIAAPSAQQMQAAIAPDQLKTLEAACGLADSPASIALVSDALKAEALVGWAIRGLRQADPVDEKLLNTGYLMLSAATRAELSKGLQIVPSDAAITEFTAWAESLKVEAGPGRSFLILYCFGRGTLEHVNEQIAATPQI